MSDLVPNFDAFMRNIDPKFTGTPFEFKGKKFNVSRHNDDLWFMMSEKYKDAYEFDPTIAFGIPFCIGYQNAMHTPDGKKIFGRCIVEAFPVPKNVQEYFKFCTVLQLDKKAESLASKLQDLSSQIRELKALLSRSLDYLQQLVAEVEQHRRDLAEIQPKFKEADQRVKALTNLMNASHEVKSLLGRDLTVLQPDFFPVVHDCEKELKIYSEQVGAKKALISGKDNMVSEQRGAIASIEANLRAQVQKKKETESALLDTRQKIFQELSSFERDVLPRQLHKYVEELHLHTNMQQAALVLAKHFKKVSIRNFVSSRIQSEPTECSICCHSHPNYFVLQCGHGAFCSICIANLKKTTGTCPQCRSMIQSSGMPLNIFDKKHLF
jgi:hypothetical protein